MCSRLREPRPRRPTDRGFCDDTRRAARSAPDLISEGYYRYNPREFHRFLNDATASLGEVRNQLLHARDEHLITEQEFEVMFNLADRAIGAANGLQAYLRRCPQKFIPPKRPPRRPPNPEPGT